MCAVHYVLTPGGSMSVNKPASSPRSFLRMGSSSLTPPGPIQSSVGTHQRLPSLSRYLFQFSAPWGPGGIAGKIVSHPLIPTSSNCKFTNDSSPWLYTIDCHPESDSLSLRRVDSLKSMTSNPRGLLGGGKNVARIDITVIHAVGCK